MLSLNAWNIIWIVVNLLVLYLIFKKSLFHLVLTVIKAREDLINEQLENAKKTNEDALEKKKNYEEQLSLAKGEADKIIMEARERAEREKVKTMEKTRKEAQTMMDRAKADIAREEESARRAAQADIARLAMVAAEKIIKSGDESDKRISK